MAKYRPQGAQCGSRGMPRESHREQQGQAGPSPDFPPPGTERREERLDFVGEPLPDNQEGRRGRGRGSRLSVKSQGAPISPLLPVSSQARCLVPP